MGALPERIEGHGLVLRHWRVADAAAQERAIAESREHLRPWMRWAATSPPTDERRALLAQWERDWAAGGDAIYAIFRGRSIAGSGGLHRRRGPAALEIGYWIHAAFVRQGIATAAARLLVDTAFAESGIERVEIHHDRANVASAGVPRGLGFRLVGERPNERDAPGEVGVDCVWVMAREDWADH